jgi:hypothetical protein
VQIPAYFKLMGRGRYISALQLYGRKLKGTVRGTWRKRGTKIIWRTGTYRRAGLYGLWYRPSSAHPKGYIAMYSSKTLEWTEITCYPNSICGLEDALDDEDVVRRARLLRHLFAIADAPGAGAVGQIELLALHGLLLGDVVDVLPHDHGAVERAFSDGPGVRRHGRILPGRRKFNRGSTIMRSSGGGSHRLRLDHLEDGLR